MATGNEEHRPGVDSFYDNSCTSCVTMPSMSTHTQHHRGQSQRFNGEHHRSDGGIRASSRPGSQFRYQHPQLWYTTDTGMSHDESSFAIQRPATSPRGFIQRRPMQPGSRAGTSQVWGWDCRDTSVCCSE